LDRLATATGTGLNETWTYDANGNRQTQGGATSSTYTVSTASNRLASISGGLTRTYAYAPSGQTTGYGGLTFTYLDSGRLSSVSNGTTTTTYVLNALGQRVKKSGTSITLFIYDESGHLLGEYDGSGNLIEETVWMGDVPVATLRPNGTGVSVYYVHTDHLNTPRRISRPSDNVIVWRWDSEPFGTASANQDPDGDGIAFVYNPRFPGQYYDAETGLNYNAYRDYDPAVGRYIESDPIGLHGGINTYAYVHSNPPLRIDPLGLCDDDEVARCKEVKRRGLEFCSDRALPTRDYGWEFQNCLNQYIEDHGCGPGGRPLPQPVAPAPAPSSPRPPTRQSPVPQSPVPQPPAPDATNSLAAIVAAILAALGVAATVPQ
jgi:RHS repeat-associated protein